MARLLTVEQYVGSAARERFVWGERDCALFVADWVAIIRGADPALSYRGLYDSEQGAALMMGARGLIGVVDRCARSAGLHRTREPRAGDIGIVTDGAGDTTCAILMPSGTWASRMAAGIVVRRAVVRMAWSF